jgi:hypothetical protein
MYSVVHIPGRANPTDFLKRKRDGQYSAASTGYADSDSRLELFTAFATAPAAAFVHVGQHPDTPLFPHTDFAAAVRATLPADSVLGSIAAAAQAEPLGKIVKSWCRSFVLRDGLRYHQSSRGDRLCIQMTGELRRTVLTELHATPLGATRPWLWPAFACGGRGCRRWWTSSSRRTSRASVSRRSIRRPPVSSSRSPSLSGHNFLQVHIDFQTGRVWLVPTFKTATSKLRRRTLSLRSFAALG